MLSTHDERENVQDILTISNSNSHDFGNNENISGWDAIEGQPLLNGRNSWHFSERMGVLHLQLTVFAFQWHL